MIYFTSDWHIGHDKPFCYSPRGFTSPEEMDTQILMRCNRVVKPEDELWILGDLAMCKNESEWDRVFESLVCKNVHFIIGNHDTDNKVDRYMEKYFFELHGYADVMKYKKYIFYLSHYPTIVNNFDDPKKVYNLSGHTHSKEVFQSENWKIYNVTVDAHDCYPVSIEQIIEDIKKKEGKYYER